MDDGDNVISGGEELATISKKVVTVIEQGYTNLAKMLEKCKLEHLLPDFVKEEVDDDMLFKLDLESSIEWDQLAVLLPTIGSRGRFRSALKEYQVSTVLFVKAFLGTKFFLSRKFKK